MPNGNKCQNSFTNCFNNPVDSVIRTISWGTKVCGLVRNNCIYFIGIQVKSSHLFKTVHYDNNWNVIEYNIIIHKTVSLAISLYRSAHITLFPVLKLHMTLKLYYFWRAATRTGLPSGGVDPCTGHNHSTSRGQGQCDDIIRNTALPRIPQSSPLTSGACLLPTLLLLLLPPSACFRSYFDNVMLVTDYFCYYLSFVGCFVMILKELFMQIVRYWKGFYKIFDFDSILFYDPCFDTKQFFYYYVNIFWLLWWLLTFMSWFFWNIWFSLTDVIFIWLSQYVLCVVMVIKDTVAMVIQDIYSLSW